MPVPDDMHLVESRLGHVERNQAGMDSRLDGIENQISTVLDAVKSQATNSAIPWLSILGLVVLIVGGFQANSTYIEEMRARSLAENNVVVNGRVSHLDETTHKYIDDQIQHGLMMENRVSVLEAESEHVKMAMSLLYEGKNRIETETRNTLTQTWDSLIDDLRYDIRKLDRKSDDQ